MLSKLDDLKDEVDKLLSILERKNNAYFFDLLFLCQNRNMLEMTKHGMHC